MTDSPNALSARAPASPQPASADAAARRATGQPAEEGFSFWDLLDVVNPLQHIPILSHFYRQVTGDEIRPPARILGDTLFGGPLGMVASVVGSIIEETSGRSPAGHVVAWISGGEEAPPTATAVADTAAPAAPVLTVAQAEPAGRKAARAGDEGRFFPLPARDGVASGHFHALPPRPTGPGEAASQADGPAAASPPDAPAPLPRDRIADAMLKALDKYQRAAVLRQPSPAPARGH